MNYETQTGYYVLVDDGGRIGAKANVSVGNHPVPEWVDLSESFDVESVDDLDAYDIEPHFRSDK